LYQAYEKWAETIGEFKHGNKQFSTELLRKNFEKTKNGCMFWHGISLSESYQRWDLEGLEGKKHKLQENDSYVECNSASVPSRMSKNEDLTPPPVTTNTSKNQLSEEAKEPTAPPAQDDKPQTASTAEVEEKVDTGGGDASEPHIQDLKPDQLGVEVRMSDFIKRPPCLNIEAFEELDSEERIDVLIQQCCSLGFYRHEIGFESLYQGLKDDYLSRTHTNLINEFTMNLEQLAVNGSYNGNGNHNGNGDQR
jgi:hypothetical protein